MTACLAKPPEYAAYGRESRGGALWDPGGAPSIIMPILPAMELSPQGSQAPPERANSGHMQV